MRPVVIVFFVFFVAVAATVVVCLFYTTIAMKPQTQTSKLVAFVCLLLLLCVYLICLVVSSRGDPV